MPELSDRVGEVIEAGEVGSSLVEEHLPSLGSAKSQSKRTRWV